MTTSVGRRDGADGVLQFARFAYPPNVLGYCGPGEHVELLERVDEQAGGPGLARLARGFDGAWPYLELLAGASGLTPLDPAVVEAYWIGSPLLDRVTGHDAVLSLDERFRDRGGIEEVVGPLRHGAVLHHSFHVLAVYPWAGLLRAGRTDPSLQVMERCLVRWGVVRAVEGSRAVVEVVTLAWDGHRLSLGPPRVEQFVRSLDGRRLVAVAVGDEVAVHWQWICDVLAPEQRRRLAAATDRTLTAVASVPVRPPDLVA